MALPASTSTLALDDLRFATDRFATRLKIFVAGPEIKKGWSWKDMRSKSASARLRLRIHNHLEVSNHESVLGEHRIIAAMASRTIPDVPSVVVTETYVAATSCSAIIIIPDSPGSFCELATWTQDEDLAGKMLILANKTFEKDVSYISPGVFSIAVDNRATLEWVDYSKWSDVRPIVDKFIDSWQQKVFRRELFRGRHNKR